MRNFLLISIAAFQLYAAKASSQTSEASGFIGYGYIDGDPDRTEELTAEGLSFAIDARVATAPEEGLYIVADFLIEGQGPGAELFDPDYRIGLGFDLGGGDTIEVFLGNLRPLGVAYGFDGFEGGLSNMASLNELMLDDIKGFRSDNIPWYGIEHSQRANPGNFDGTERGVQVEFDLDSWGVDATLSYLPEYDYLSVAGHYRISMAGFTGGLFGDYYRTTQGAERGGLPKSWPTTAGDVDSHGYSFGGYVEFEQLVFGLGHAVLWNDAVSGFNGSALPWGSERTYAFATGNLAEGLEGYVVAALRDPVSSCPNANNACTSGSMYEAGLEYTLASGVAFSVYGRESDEAYAPTSSTWGDFGFTDVGVAVGVKF